MRPEAHGSTCLWLPQDPYTPEGPPKGRTTSG